MTYELDEATKADIAKRFKTAHPNYHADAAQLSADFVTLAQNACQRVPPGRERALVLTKLEEAWFWGCAGIERK